ncbi:MAG: hypothetical protein LQ341_006873 [Variospora aurantia]|nr:MAG: hypothetical protein LQ341_006873 [Variospora aurantia]
MKKGTGEDEGGLDGGEEERRGGFERRFRQNEVKKKREVEEQPDERSPSLLKDYYLFMAPKIRQAQRILPCPTCPTIDKSGVTASPDAAGGRKMTRHSKSPSGGPYQDQVYQPFIPKFVEDGEVDGEGEGDGSDTFHVEYAWCTLSV